jgi:hypothetical protein
MDDDTLSRIALIAAAYERERGYWDWWVAPPPPDCDASYFRLRRFASLDAPAFIIEHEIALLRRKLALMQRERLGVNVH